MIKSECNKNGELVRETIKALVQDAAQLGLSTEDNWNHGHENQWNQGDNNKTPQQSPIIKIYATIFRMNYDKDSQDTQNSED